MATSFVTVRDVAPKLFKPPVSGLFTARKFIRPMLPGSFHLHDKCRKFADEGSAHLPFVMECICILLLSRSAPAQVGPNFAVVTSLPDCGEPKQCAARKNLAAHNKSDVRGNFPHPRYCCETGDYAGKFEEINPE